VAIAALAARYDRVLWLGCAGHAMWDVLHFERVSYVPDRYVAACIAADPGVCDISAYELARRKTLRKAQDAGMIALDPG